jgi:hypothetical protein
MNGERATLQFPASLFGTATAVELGFPDFQRPVGVSVSCCGRVLTPPGLSTQDRSVRFMIDKTMKDRRGDTITLEIRAASAFRPKDRGKSLDERLLGAGVETVTIFRRDANGAVFARCLDSLSKA